MELSQNEKKTISDFKILKTLGEGSFGDVKLIQDNQTQKNYCLKEISKKFLYESNKPHFVFLEKMFLQYFNFPFMARLIYSFQDQKNLYFCLEHLPNGELGAFAERNYPLNLNNIRFIAAEIVLILEQLHGNGILHRDIKPENFIIDEKHHLRIVDFGTAALIPIKGVNEKIYEVYLNLKEKFDPSFDKNNNSDVKINNRYKIDFSDNHKNSLRVMDLQLEQSKTRNFNGSIYYVSPEIVIDDSIKDFGSDFWSFGVLLYYITMQDYPFKAKGEHLIIELIKTGEYRLDPNMNEDLKSLVEGLLKFNSKERLGNGPKESEFDIQALKNHPFFKGIDWSNLREQPSPLSAGIFTDIKDSEEMLRGFDDDFTDDKNNEIVKKGSVLMEGFNSEKLNVILVLSSLGKLSIFNFKNLELIQELRLGINFFCKVEGNDRFFLSTIDGVVKFECSEGEADSWVDKMKTVIEKLN